jgi:DNA-binding PadR family transcriptional regulator
MAPNPTTTSYAVLGLLSVRSWTTYELAKQVRRSLNWFWPRAERKLYDEPKHLAARGYAVATEQFTGKRRSREYSITAEGRQALTDWLGEPAAPRTAEFEALVKVFFADCGDRDQLRRTLEGIATEARDRVTALSSMALAPPTFPERAHISALTLPLQLEQETAVLRWARWALGQVEQWDDTRQPGSWDSTGVLRDVARRSLDEAGEPLDVSG